VLDLGGNCYLSTRQIGVMDPTIAACAGGSVTQNDLAAFDAMGWNLSQNIPDQSNLQQDHGRYLRHGRSGTSCT
jgi:hypothetical protein